MKSFINFLPPWVETNCQPAFYDVESGTVLQQTARMYAKVNQIIRHFNDLSKEVQEYIQQFIDLKDYVDTYFDNLDVQEEINNKLDAMAESGALAEIIAQFLGLGALVVFNTEEDMIESEQLIKGAKAKTLGKNTLGDGFGAYYSIDESGDIALANGLYATLVSDYGGNNYYDEITVEQIRRYDTDCYITTIPVNDSFGNQIKPHIEYDDETPLTHAGKTFSTITTNASLAIYDGSHYYNPNIIGDGVLLNKNDGFVNATEDYYLYLGIKPDRTIEEFKVNNTTAAQLLASGCIQVFDVYFKLVEHGVASDLSSIVIQPTDIINIPNPRQCLGVKQDGTWIILTCDGRTGNDAGLTSTQCQNILIEYGCYNAWNLDGGGSTSTVHKGSKINRNIDNNRTSERKIAYTLNFRKDTINKELAKSYTQIGKEKQASLEQVYESTLQNRSRDESGVDCDSIYGRLVVGHGNNMVNRPVSRSGYIVNIPHCSAQYYNLFNKQLYFDRDTAQIYTRQQVEGNWTKWQPNALITSLYTSANQTIEADSTYETISCGTSVVGNDIDSVITINNDNTFSVNNRINLLVVRATITVNPSTSGDKFIKLTKNGSDISSCIFNAYCESGKNNLVNVEFVTTLSTGSQAPNDKYAIQFYGNKNDVLKRRRISIEIR